MYRARAYEEAKRVSLDATRGGPDGKTFNVTSRYARKFKDAPTSSAYTVQACASTARPLAGQTVKRSRREVGRRGGGRREEERADIADIAGTITRITLQSYADNARSRTHRALHPPFHLPSAPPRPPRGALGLHRQHFLEP